ncbi:DUF4123 domain-containing protein [Photorhabdus sp. RM71S]|uniref:DUF4123 domain-containing protein n=1 Tax=Photorhabdus sp. RM71S TaxID=3342824 RepID=UPI0036D93ED0
MNRVQITDWIASLEASVTEAHLSYIDMIVDQSGGEFSLIPALQSFSPEIDWCSLFQGLPEERAVNEAPILFRIDLTQPDQRQWMREIILSLADQSLLLVLGSTWSFSHLSQRLIQCVDAAHSGQAGILRFFDPRVFPVLFSHVLDAEQQQSFLRPALFWSWLDYDGAPHSVWGQGDAGPVNETREKIDLTDKQLEHILCVSDAHRLVLQLNRGEYPEATLAQLFNGCYALMIEASDKPVFLDDDRESFVLSHLKSRLSSM